MERLKAWQKPLSYALFAGVFLILCFFLYRYTVFTLDSDAASELVLAKHLSDRGAILSRDWLYGSELRVVYSQLIFAPLFRLTGDWSAVRMLGTGIMLLMLLAAFCLYCRETGSRTWYPLAGLVLLLPLSRIYLDVLYKFTYYLPHVIAGFLIPALVLGGRSSKGRAGALAAGAVLSLALGLNGLRLILSLYIPLFLALALLAWQDRGGALVLAGRGALVSAAAMTGCLVNILFLSRRYTLLDMTAMSFKNFSLQGLEKVLGGLLEVYGFRPDEPVFSTALVYGALGGLLLLLSLGCSFYILRRREVYSQGERFAAAYYICSLLAMVLLYSFAAMQFTLRYMVQTAVLGVLPVFICLGKPGLWGRGGRLALLGLVCLSLVCGALHYNELRKEDKTRAQRECAEYLVSQGYTRGYASFWNGNVLTELSDGALEMWVWDEHFAGLESPDQMVGFLQAKSHLEPPEGEVFVLLSANEDAFCGFSQSFREDSLAYKTQGYEPYALDEYVIYRFDSYEDLLEQFGQGGDHGQAS